MSSRAGIEMTGPTLRYVELAFREGERRTVRLGSCEFDFDVEHEVFRTTRTEHLDTIAAALTDIFAGSTASELRVALHPPYGHSFFSPLPQDAEEAEQEAQLREELALLMGSDVAPTLQLTTEPVFSEVEGEQETTWYHGLALGGERHRRFGLIAEVLPPGSYRPVLSTRAVARVLALGRPVAAGPQAPFTLALGWYAGHVEFALCREDTWYFSHHAEAVAPVDAAYFAALLLRRLHLTARQVGRVVLYGPDLERDAFAPLQMAFSVDPEVLDPIQILDVEQEGLGSGVDTAAYAPCIGAALGS